MTLSITAAAVPGIPARPPTSSSITEPAAARPPPENCPSTVGPPGRVSSNRAGDSDEWEGLRPWRRGDPLKLVVWKKAAKNDELVSRDTVHAQRSELWLDLQWTGQGDLEHKLSRLCAWVLAAEAQGLDYGLRLPGQEIRPDSGEAHKRRCLEALALC